MALCVISMCRLAWTFNGGLLPNNTNVDTIGTNRSELVISNPGDGNTGMYACLASTPSEAFKQIAAVMVEFYGKSTLASSPDFPQLFVIYTQSKNVGKPGNEAKSTPTSQLQ